jgi:hypothetical protein
MVDVKLLGQRFRFSDRTRPPATPEGRAHLAEQIIRAQRKAKGEPVDDDAPAKGSLAAQILAARAKVDR